METIDTSIQSTQVPIDEYPQQLKFIDRNGKEYIGHRLINYSGIEQSIAKLGAVITNNHVDEAIKGNVILLGNVENSVMFMGSLLKELQLPVIYDFIKVDNGNLLPSCLDLATLKDKTVLYVNGCSNTSIQYNLVSNILKDTYKAKEVIAVSLTVSDKDIDTKGNHSYIAYHLKNLGNSQLHGYGVKAMFGKEELLYSNVNAIYVIL